MNYEGDYLSTHIFYDDNLACDGSRSDLDGEIFNTGSQLDFGSFILKQSNEQSEFFPHGLWAGRSVHYDFPQTREFNSGTVQDRSLIVSRLHTLIGKPWLSLI